MSRIKASVRSLLLVMCLMASLFISSTPANASSVYDNAYTTTDTLWLGESNFYGINCPYIDVSYDIETLLDEESNWQSSTNYSSWWPDFEIAKNQGSWALSQYRHQAGGGETRQVWVTYSATPGEIYWPDAYNVRAVATEVITLVVTTRQQYYGNGGCTPLVLSYSGTGQDISRDGSVYGPQFTENYVAVNWDVEYPDSEYAGEFIRTEQPLPATTFLTGTVDCIDPAKQPTYMYITQAGNNGYATLTYSSPAVADWSYNLASTPYQVTVGCGDVLAASFGSVDPATTSEVWVCDIYSNPAECQTS